MRQSAVSVTTDRRLPHIHRARPSPPTCRAPPSSVSSAQPCHERAGQKRRARSVGITGGNDRPCNRSSCPDQYRECQRAVHREVQSVPRVSTSGPPRSAISTASVSERPEGGPVIGTRIRIRRAAPRLGPPPRPRRERHPVRAEPRRGIHERRSLRGRGEAPRGCAARRRRGVHP